MRPRRHGKLESASDAWKSNLHSIPLSGGCEVRWLARWQACVVYLAMRTGEDVRFAGIGCSPGSTTTAGIPRLRIQEPRLYHHAPANRRDKSNSPAADRVSSTAFWKFSIQAAHPITHGSPCRCYKASSSPSLPPTTAINPHINDPRLCCCPGMTPRCFILLSHIVHTPAAHLSGGSSTGHSFSPANLGRCATSRWKGVKCRTRSRLGI